MRRSLEALVSSLEGDLKNFWSLALKEPQNLSLELQRNFSP